MATLYYEFCLFVSVILTLIYIYVWHKHFNVHLTVVFALIPIANLGYVITSRSQSLDEAVIGTKIIYLGACYLLLLVLLGIIGLCRINMPRFVRALLFVFSTVCYISVLSVGRFEWFYKKDLGFVTIDNSARLIKHYGPMHTVFYIMIIIYVTISIIALFYAYLRNNQVSRLMIILFFTCEIMAVLSYVGSKVVYTEVELVPIVYILAQIVFLIISSRLHIYDVDDSVIDSIIEKGTTGLISFDFNMKYLGSNKAARDILPGLNELAVDMKMTKDSSIGKVLMPWIEAYEKDDSKDKFHYHLDDKYYLFDINHLFDGKQIRGYQFVITDDTQDQKYIELINNFNNELQEQVAIKTKSIIDMHNNLVISMATMVESRDNSTGGHIMRTSNVVAMIVGEMLKDRRYHNMKSYFDNVIKAAPMHDLGKIAVDDAILRKPGRFEPWEFEKMKAHAAEGAKIVHSILEKTDDEEFKTIAENVAHYHHERWDGSGYPEGLKGGQIPFEARIMAIADVYDALVSKRVYKDKMSFEQADQIIMEGMGKHFDRGLEPFYIAARPRLEAYYSSLEQEDNE